MYLVFDGGYFGNKNGLGVLAVVLVDGENEELIHYDYRERSSSSDIEWEAAKVAEQHARRLGISVVKGDFLACIQGMAEQHPDISWEWIPSRSNNADKFAKWYPELL